MQVSQPCPPAQLMCDKFWAEMVGHKTIAGHGHRTCMGNRGPHHCLQTKRREEERQSHTNRQAANSCWHISFPRRNSELRCAPAETSCSSRASPSASTIRRPCALHLLLSLLLQRKPRR